MTPACRHEQAIAAALRKGELPDELRLHLQACATCGEIHSVARDMRQFAAALADRLPPSAASMWWRLELKMRRDRARRAQAPLIWMTRTLYASVALGAVMLASLVPTQPVITIGLAALTAVALPIALALWGWSRSNL